MRATFLVWLTAIIFNSVVAFADEHKSWVEDVLSFSEEIEPYLFDSQEDDWDKFLDRYDFKPIPERLDMSLEAAFTFVISLNYSGYQNVHARYASLLESHGEPRHHDMQEVLDITSSVVEAGDFAAAIEQLSEFSKRENANTRPRMMSYVALAYLQFDDGDKASAMKTLQNARMFAKNEQLPPLLEVELEKMSGYVLQGSGDNGAVLESWRKGFELYREYGFPFETSSVMSNLSYMLFKSGEYESGHKIARKRMSALNDSVPETGRFLTYLDCAGFELEVKHYSAARDCIQMAGDLLHAVPERRIPWEVLNIRILARTGRVEDAQKRYDALIADPKTALSGYANSKLPFVETELLYLSGDGISAYDKLQAIREAELIENVKVRNEIGSQLRNLMEFENEHLFEKNSLREKLYSRQRYTTLLALGLAIAMLILSYILFYARKRAQKRSTIDAMTGVLNRAGFSEKSVDLLNFCRQKNERLALCLIDLDGFKLINDAYGHAAGDHVLREVAYRLKSTLGEDVAIGRLGGDEFAFVLTGQESNLEIQDIGDAVCAALEIDIQISNSTIKPRGSVGIAVFPDAGDTIQKLYDCADYALYAMKSSAPGTAKIFDLSHKTKLERQHEVEAALMEARPSEFHLQYQPIVCAQKAVTVGFEALGRWCSPTLGNVPPEEFIPQAERTSQIRRLTLYLVERALNEAAAWPDHLTLSLNLSSQDLATLDSAKIIRETILRSEFPPERIIVELTETAIIRDTAATRQALEQLSDIGVKIALDDFGTGFSSLNHIYHLPIDRIKVDQSLTALIAEESGSKPIVELLLKMCQSLNLECVIEGVERGAQKDILVELGADFLQGFHYARPMCPDKVIDYLERETTGVTTIVGAEDSVARSA